MFQFLMGDTLPQVFHEPFDGGEVIGEDEDVYIEVANGSVVMTYEQAFALLPALGSVLSRMKHQLKK
jgi:hypothetical protein